MGIGEEGCVLGTAADSSGPKRKNGDQDKPPGLATDGKGGQEPSLSGFLKCGAHQALFCFSVGRPPRARDW